MSKLNVYIIACVFVLLPISLYSQSYSISGEINSKDNEKISYANALLLRANDSTIVSGTISDDKGKFIINDVSKGVYILKATFLGYQDYVKSIDLKSDINIGAIILKEALESLSEVSILAQKPTLKRQTDRLIFNVKNTSLTEGSVWNILKSTPGILMINDEISVKNASNIIYLINDRRVYLSGEELQQLLSGTNASTVEAIEVITNPSAKYDAEGDAVINIKMSNNLIAGYHGSIYSNYTQGVYPRVTAGTNHFFKGKKTNFYIGYNFNAQKLNRLNEERINFIENDQLVGNWNTDLDRNTKTKTHTANINFDYNINDNSTLSISANGLLTPFWKRTTNSFTRAIDSTFLSINDTDDNILNLGTNMDYVYTSKKGSRVSLNAHHTNYNYDRLQNVSTVYRDATGGLIRSNRFNTTSNQDIKIYSGQLDVSFPIKNGAFETGTKYSKIDSNSDIDQTTVSLNPQNEDFENSGVFNYNENNYAAYINMNKDWTSWSLSLGLRAEYTDALGSLSTNIQDNDFDYLEWFPNANITHRFNDAHSLGVSYSRRIERPTYTNLNPFRFFLNDNAFVIGNPNLQPAITQLATLSYSINDTYTFEVYYRTEDNTFSELSFQDNTLNRIFYQASNLKEEVDYGFDFIMYNTITKGWTSYVVTSLFNNKAQFFAAQTDNSVQTNEQWSFYGNVINYLNLSNDNSFTATLSLLYISPVVDGSATVSSRSQVDVSLKKSFAQGKWIASLSANDIFQGSDFTVTNDYLDQDNEYYSLFDNRWIRLGLRYNFGNTKLSKNDNIKELDERNRLNKKN